jgi:hypothetical protein
MPLALSVMIRIPVELLSGRIFSGPAYQNSTVLWRTFFIPSAFFGILGNLWKGF